MWAIGHRVVHYKAIAGLALASTPFSVPHPYHPITITTLTLTLSPRHLNLIDLPINKTGGGGGGRGADPPDPAVP